MGHRCRTGEYKGLEAMGTSRMTRSRPSSEIMTTVFSFSYIFLLTIKTEDGFWGARNFRQSARLGMCCDSAGERS